MEGNPGILILSSDAAVFRIAIKGSHTEAFCTLDKIPEAIMRFDSNDEQVIYLKRWNVERKCFQNVDRFKLIRELKEIVSFSQYEYLKKHYVFTQKKLL